MGLPAAQSDDPRRWASLGMLVVVALASIATSADSSMIEASEPGEALLLSREHPEATAQFTFDATEEALGGLDSLGLSVEFETFWSDARNADRTVQVALVKTDGPEVEDWQLELAGCTATRDCVGTYQVTFTWPREVQRGSVRVEWHVEASIAWSRSQPPAGAELELIIQQPADPGMAPQRLLEQEVILELGDPVRVEVVTLESRAALPSDLELALEVGRVFAHHRPEAWTILWQPETDRSLDVPPGTATAIDIPQRCRQGPCSFMLSVVSGLDQTEAQRQWVSWGLTTNHPEIDLSTEVVPRVPPALTASVDLGTIRIQGDTRKTIVVRIDVPPAALPSEEFGMVGPVLQGTVNLGIEGLQFPDDGNLTLNLESSDPSAPRSVVRLGQRTWRRATIGTIEPLSFVVPNGCLTTGSRPGNPQAPAGPGSGRPLESCAVEFIVQLETGGFALNEQPGWVRLSPSVEISMPFPLTGRVPDGAELTLTVEPVT